MPPIRVTINWPDGATAPSVDQDPIVVPASSGATVIQWVCGTNVASLSISGLDDAQFNPAASNGYGNSFSTTDANNNATLYNYTFGATHTAGHTSTHDPRIQNGG